MAINNYYKYQSSHLGKKMRKKNHTMLNLFCVLHKFRDVCTYFPLSMRKLVMCSHSYIPQFTIPLVPQ